MKKAFLIAFAVFALGFISHATTIVPEKTGDNSSETVVNDNETLSTQDLQATSDIRKGMSYKELKTIYNPKEYVPDTTDPYSPGISAVCSFIVPGLGQILDGEVERGLLMLGGTVVLAGVASATAYYAPMIALPAFAGYVALDIWSIIDALNVAKVKNMYNQDLRKLIGNNGINVSLSPSLAYVPMSGSLTPAAGVALRISF